MMSQSVAGEVIPMSVIDAGSSMIFTGMSMARPSYISLAFGPESGFHAF